MASNLNKTLVAYYSKRVKEYETIYHRSDKVRLQEQEQIGDYIKKSFKNRYVLEVACGTGYWTKYLLTNTEKVIAIDLSQEVLEIASNRYSPRTKISFLRADAYNPPVSFPPFTGSMTNLWLSHIPKRKIKSFLKTLHSRLAPNSFVVFVDDVYRKELSGQLIHPKYSQDTWKRRQLNSGEEYVILKNYYTRNQLLQIFSPYSSKINIKYLTNFWVVGYSYNKT